MTTAKKNLFAALALVLGAAVTGCAADAPADPNDPNDPSDVDPNAPPPDATGKYAMRSTFDLASNAPGAAGAVVNAIIAATDEGDDPAKWILEQAINAMPSGTFKNVVNGAKPFIAGIINDRILSIAPDFVTTMVQVGNDVGQVARGFGLNETLDVSKAGDAYAATKTVKGVHFKIDGLESDHAFSDFGVSETVVSQIGVTVSKTGQLAIADHKVGLSYGKVIRIGLDAAIIPSLDPSAQNLGQLLQHLVNCNAVGTAINDAVISTIGFGPGAGTFTSACNAGLVAGANFIYSKVDAIDGQAMELGLAGTAKALDKNNDKKLDTIQTGTWTGTATYAGTPAPLATATFYGERM
ncbi:MAG: hypothetical protein KIT31_03285 [Deltaproteobacteria bacterium]|nr:hypothetical protein [Deltaproteobacteria bacterium]